MMTYRSETWSLTMGLIRRLGDTQWAIKRVMLEVYVIKLEMRTSVEELELPKQLSKSRNLSGNGRALRSENIGLLRCWNGDPAPVNAA
ncbi:jg13618 [Pararge aegeria aegeria]|uniref:Jg13618 protein n=1 Tax=Pararge aegeria aegeria TaxID=348720 RepID=A0A8S4QSY0_9NEOP|nr:jg13618 [Pararge aegeria aegeria]